MPLDWDHGIVGRSRPDLNPPPGVKAGRYPRACRPPIGLVALMVTLRPQRWHRCTVAASLTVACIATWQTGQGFGGGGLSGWFMATQYRNTIPPGQLRMFT